MNSFLNLIEFVILLLQYEPLRPRAPAQGDSACPEDPTSLKDPA